MELLWLVPALPFAGFLALALWGPRFGRRTTAAVGVGSIGLSAAAALGAAADFVASPPPGRVFTQTLWTWFQIGSFRPAIGFTLDALSLTMVLVVTVVGFLIHLYASEFMENEEGYSRFFAYMNLFVGSMLVLLLADNLLLLYLGWEGVGLCSYLLIGFWYRDSANGAAARKAFIVTRVGDTAMAVGLFLLFTRLGTLSIPGLMERAAAQWPVGAAPAVAAAALLLGGAVGKSAQLPLQTWLPDAMAGPTPVSALIHAATMVTAGVYLIARTHVLFELAPGVQLAVALVGAVTLLLSGLSALTQSDIKRVLAYSTISQIGYMFLALGVGAWGAGIFHFVTHAFFKALLFLGAGAVILGLDHEHDIFRMGGLRRQLPVAFWTFLIGAASLSAVPLVTAGFYSKERILSGAWSSAVGGHALWTAGCLGAFITSVYTFRMVFVAWFGKASRPVRRKPGARIHIPLVTLAALSVVGGFAAVPAFLESALPSPHESVASHAGRLPEILAGVASLAGIALAYLLFLRDRALPERLSRTSAGRILHRWGFVGWGFDRLYAALFVNPYIRIARANRNDGVDHLYGGIAYANRFFHRALSRTETGRVRGYAAAIALGAVAVIAAMVFL